MRAGVMHAGVMHADVQAGYRRGESRQEHTHTTQNAAYDITSGWRGWWRLNYEGSGRG